MTAVRVNAAGGLLQFDKDSATCYDAFAFLDAILDFCVDAVGGTNLHLSLLEEFRVYLYENEVIAHFFQYSSASDAQSLVSNEPVTKSLTLSISKITGMRGEATLVCLP